MKFSSRKIAVSLLAVGLTAAVPWDPASPGPVDSSLQSEAASTWEDCQARFAREVETWEQRMKEAENGRERSALRKAHPAIAFEAEVLEHLENGELQAAFWVLDHLKELGVKFSARSERQLALYERMIREFSEHPDFTKGLQRMFDDRSFIRKQGLETVERLAASALAQVSSESDRAKIQYGLAHCAAAAATPEATGKALAWIEELIGSEHLSDEELQSLADLRFELMHLRKGCLAPEFEGTTVDGDPIRSEDLRGKVVVLDFFGFW